MKYKAWSAGIVSMVLAFVVPFSALAAKPQPIEPAQPPAFSEFIDLTEESAVIHDAPLDFEIGDVVNKDRVRKSKIKGTQEFTIANTDPIVAVLSIFVDPTETLRSSSGLSIDSGRHAWITIRNVGNTTINVGKLSGVAPGKTISVGTWGDTSRTKEHNGIWYNLESWLINKENDLNARISVGYALKASELNRLNNYIINNDRWSKPYNCSSFASGAWNTSVESYMRVGAGSPNTPKNLANNIKAKWGNYATNAAIPYAYNVYYAQGTGLPKQSTVFK
jgi:hypothetical protein